MGVVGLVCFRWFCSYLNGEIFEAALKVGAKFLLLYIYVGYWHVVSAEYIQSLLSLAYA